MWGSKNPSGKTTVSVPVEYENCNESSSADKYRLAMIACKLVADKKLSVNGVNPKAAKDDWNRLNSFAHTHIDQSKSSLINVWYYRSLELGVK